MGRAMFKKFKSHAEAPGRRGKQARRSHFSAPWRHCVRMFFLPGERLRAEVGRPLLKGVQVSRILNVIFSGDVARHCRARRRAMSRGWGLRPVASTM